MNKIKNSGFFRIISLILIITFISLDIAYAYPPENSTLAAPSALQQQPINEHAARFQQSVFSQGALLASVYDIGEYFFGRPEKNMESLPSEYVKEVVKAGLGKILGNSGIEILNIVPVEYLKKTAQDKDELENALKEIGFKGTLPDEGVVFILYRKDGKKFLVQIAERDKVSAVNLPGYEWVVSDKYVVKYIPENYEAPQGEAISPSSAAKEAPKATVSEPIAEVESPATKATDLPQAPKRIFTIRAIISSLVLIFLTASSSLLFAADSATGPSSEGTIFSGLKEFAFAHPVIVWAAIAVIGIILLRKIIRHRVRVAAGFDLRPAETDLLKKKYRNYIMSKETLNQKFLAISKSRVDASIQLNIVDRVKFLDGRADYVDTCQFIIAFKPPSAFWLADDNRSFSGLRLKQLNVYPYFIERLVALSEVWPELAQRVFDSILTHEEGHVENYRRIADTQMPSREALRYLGRQDEKDAFDYLVKMRGQKTLLLTSFWFQAYLHPSYELEEHTEEYFRSFYKFPFYTPTNEDWAYVMSIEKEYARKSDRSVGTSTIKKIVTALVIALTPITLFAADSATGPSSEGTIFSGLKDFAFAHPIFAGIVAIGIGIAAFFAIWRIFFPVSWHLWRMHSNDPYVRRAAARALGEIKDPRATKPLIKLLSDSDWNVRRAAAWALGDIKDSEAIDSLIKALSDSDEGVRHAAAYALSKINDLRAVEPLIKALSDSGEHVRSAAAGALGGIEDPRAVEPLIKLLSDSDEGVRHAAIEALGRIGDPRAVEPLIKVLSGYASLCSSRTREVAAKALENIGSPAVSALMKLLIDRARSVRETAAEVLGRIRDPRAVELLIKLLGDSDWSVYSYAAVEALGRIGDSRAVEPLIGLLRSSDWSVHPPTDSHHYNYLYVITNALGNIEDPRLSFMQDYLKIISVKGYWYCKSLKGEEIEYIVNCLKKGIEIEAYLTPFITHEEDNPYDSGPTSFTVVDSPAELIIDMKPGDVPQKDALAPSTAASAPEVQAQPAVKQEPAAEKPALPQDTMAKPAEPANTGKTTQLFEIVESALIGKRGEFIDAGNKLIDSIAAKSGAEAIASIGILDKDMATAEIRQRVEKAIAAIGSLDKEGITPETKTAIESLKKNLNQLTADGAVASLIVLARRAKREGQKLIIGLETDWIPGIDVKGSLQRQAISALMNEIDSIGEALKSMGLDNVEIIRGSSSQLADSLIKAAEDSRTDMHNIVVMASKETIEKSDGFKAFRDASAKDKPFLTGIDPVELVKLYEQFRESSASQIHIKLTAMLYMTLEIAAGKEPPQAPWIQYDPVNRILILVPSAEPIDYKKLKDAYKAEVAALQAA